MKQPPASELIVCTTCRRSNIDCGEGQRPGQKLFDTLSKRKLPDGLILTGTKCLQNCNQGCTIALRGGLRWTYVFGNLDSHADINLLLEGAGQYHATDDGIIPWSERPEHFKRNCVARIPPLSHPAGAK
ncbi:MAG: DUF1636 domain-containing protein [Aestuariivita sp.]|nr:DUF1636 domain-containing protein [Aestuariivita sp.]MCY4202681.1 DUF1636 domain-containing protein [Aestuariivita sp.]